MSLRDIWERLFGTAPVDVEEVEIIEEPTFVWEPNKIVLPGLYRCCPIIDVTPYTTRNGRSLVVVHVDIVQGSQHIGPGKIYCTLQLYASLLDGLAILRTPNLKATVGRWVNIEAKHVSMPDGGGTHLSIKGPLL